MEGMDPEEPLTPPLPGPTALDPSRPPYRDPRAVQGALKARWDAMEAEDGFPPWDEPDPT